MKLSEDVHRCSAVLQRGSLPETIRLQLVRPLVKNEILTLWFSNELLAAMDVPFLNPINIQGRNNYLRIKLLRLYPTLNNPGTSVIYYRSYQLIFKILISMKLIFFFLSTWHYIFSFRPSSEPPQNSAFRPYYHYLPPGSDSPSLTETTSSYSQPALPSFCDRDVFLQRQAAEIETLVSNLGQSKQGHLCLYCGKIYSRKYGLKIHIRTHTGFKPLKCKYCLRPFGDPSNLNKHVRLHADTETPYRCDLCGKMLVRKRDLDRHIKSRHGNLLP
ncbi:unnamed protein product [Nesidiocoris tenuis]|uniref:C2H2-type domain-containing protein n=1 Tax=Nesidiocoris tenuis TaxID=355587 RepID=A0A6H5GEW9_9HEMI|nr:unnamed protein product [Nesidiocoris tenuis]